MPPKNRFREKAQSKHTELLRMVQPTPPTTEADKENALVNDAGSVVKEDLEFGGGENEYDHLVQCLLLNKDSSLVEFRNITSNLLHSADWTKLSYDVLHSDSTKPLREKSETALMLLTLAESERRRIGQTEKVKIVVGDFYEIQRKGTKKLPLKEYVVRSLSPDLRNANIRAAIIATTSSRMPGDTAKWSLNDQLTFLVRVILKQIIPSSFESRLTLTESESGRSGTSQSPACKQMAGSALKRRRVDDKENDDMPFQTLHAITVREIIRLVCNHIDVANVNESIDDPTGFHGLIREAFVRVLADGPNRRKRWSGFTESEYLSVLKMDERIPVDFVTGPRADNGDTTPVVQRIADYDEVNVERKPVQKALFVSKEEDDEMFDEDFHPGGREIPFDDL